MNASNTRKIAYDIIYDVKYNKAYSNIAINKRLKKSDLDYRDRGFITELVYGTLSKLILLDYIIDVNSSISLNKISKSALTVIELSIYQIMFMDSVSEFAAVNEGVKLIKKVDKRASGYANALLRNISSNKGHVNLENIRDKAEKLSVEYSVSKYIVSRFLRIYKEEFTIELLKKLSERPKLTIRTNTLKISSMELEILLTKEGIEVEKSSMIEDAFYIKNLKNIGSNELFQKGYFVIQDISSMLAARELGAEEGEEVLDMCSAPGGKTFYMAQMMNNKGKIDAMDISEHKLKLLSGRASELGVEIINIHKKDATVFDEKMLAKYDKILIDAPCSGFGIIRRKPEIRYKEYLDVKDLPLIQAQIIANAGRYLKPGGTMVYSTCTLEKKENKDIIMSFLENNKGFILENMKELYPNVDETDGFFIAKIKKER
ncbi:16S rRNA (cytosine967-C5)-methyltransferase [Acetoanaerobium pronyense]|uniref:16S rRNA (cytosine(967)-C(5))-methyltransferase n=1 Tax=Acetoanaerobium pronyense TaxID=1482736 RepID=A0ABS4KH94_9FIRM|nr:16S rRNA (cytosine(967)-C(5))-methyltransferase RsmB [Acetoanaerobium pronyense]MBP2026631.1 16S rRNA (cytosine967-C5)-methyltransferase [Acetoanaerobium pronyense]